MPLTLPNLDDRRYADLVEEARALIPTYAPEWTNHNPSDPGITLIELFAWLTEMQIYRLNRVTDDNVRTFLKLLNGKDWRLEHGADLKAAIRDSVLKLRQVDRAVTAADHEVLAREASPEVARAKAMLRRNLGAIGESERQLDREGHISLIILPRVVDLEDPSLQPTAELIKAVDTYLDQRRLLTTRQHVVGPVYAPISADFLITRQADVPEQSLREPIVQAIRTFLHPLKGGLDGRGWPFGRSVYISELNQLLERIPGLDYIADIGLFSQCRPDAVRCAQAPPLWNDEGDLIGLALQDYHLPLAQIDPGRLVIATTFVPVQVGVEVTVGAGVKITAELRGAIKTVVKRLFHPLYSGPNGKTARTIDQEAIRIALLQLPEVDAIKAIQIKSDLMHEVRDQQGAVVAVHIGEQELVNAIVTVTLSTGANQ